MPLAENPGAVAVGCQNFRHRRKLAPQIRPSAADVHRAVAQRIDAGYELPARWRAHWLHVEICEADTLRTQPIDLRGLDHRIAVHRDIAITLIVDKDNEDVGFESSGWQQAVNQTEDCEKKESFHQSFHHKRMLLGHAVARIIGASSLSTQSYRIQLDLVKRFLDSLGPAGSCDDHWRMVRAALRSAKLETLCFATRR
jgi:hypothetical protein